MPASQTLIYPDAITKVWANAENPVTISVGNDTLSYGTTTALGSTLLAGQSVTVYSTVFIRTAADGAVNLRTYDDWDFPGDDVTEEELELLTESPFNVKAYGAVGDGVTYDDEAFATVLALASQVSDPHFTGGDISRLGEIVVPPGNYLLSEPLELTRSVVLRGSSGSGWFGSSILRFDAGCDGIVVKGYTGDSDDPRGDWSVIKDLVVSAAAKTTEAHGIKLEARAKVENCWVYRFKGNGIHIEASIPGPTANNWYVGYCRVEDQDGHGMFVSGNDANAGVAIGVDCSDNDGYGFVDEALLGSLYLGCHTAGNTLGGYSKPVEHEVNTSTFVACYTEGGQEDDITAPAIVVGRITGGTEIGNAAALESGGADGLFSSSPINVYDRSQHDETVNTDIYVQIRDPGSEATVMRIKNDTDGEYVASWQDHRLYFKHNASDNRQAFAITGDDATEGAGQFLAPNGVYLFPNGCKVLGGNGDPNNAVTAERGSLFLRMDGGAGSSLYVKESGSGDTGWAAK